MNNTIDTTNVCLEQTEKMILESVSISWFVILVLILIIIIAILFFLLIYRKNEHYSVKSRILNEGDIDFNNIMDSSFKAKELYDKLKKVCHPDKYPKDELLNTKATEIFSLLVKNRYDYSELLKLKEVAKKELNINID